MARPVAVILAVLSLVAAASAAPAVPGSAMFGRGVLTIIQGSTRAVLQVEVADTPERRAQGLMFRTRLAGDAGMLFIFDTSERWSFWMKNTLIPLSIAFIDEHWTIVDMKDMRVAPDPKNGPFEYYDSAAPARYALEVNQGYFSRNRINIGAKIRFTPK